MAISFHLYQHKLFIVTLLALAFFALANANAKGVSRGHKSSGAVSVKGHYTKNGTYVAPHMRSHPDGSVSNNWSTKGNVNPYTGKPGTKITPNGYGGSGLVRSSVPSNDFIRNDKPPSTEREMGTTPDLIANRNSAWMAVFAIFALVLCIDVVATHFFQIKRSRFGLAAHDQFQITSLAIAKLLRIRIT